MLIVFGLLSGCLLNVLVGLVGSRRRIGFGWTFFWSLVFTPFIGLVIALVSDPLPPGQKRWGCLAPLILSVLFVMLAATLLWLLLGRLTPCFLV